MELDPQILEIQKNYPLIYHACHTEHVRAASSEAQLSSRDSAVLAHLCIEELTIPTRLAKHLNISLSTLSEATANLQELGYVKSKRHESDDRKQRLVLTEKGLLAMKKASVLDTEKVSKLLSRLSVDDRKRAIEGLSILGRAALAT